MISFTSRLLLSFILKATKEQMENERMASLICAKKMAQNITILCHPRN